MRERSIKMNSDSENDSLNVEIENLSMQNDEQAAASKQQATDDLMFIKPNSKSKKSAGDGNGKKSKKKEKQSSSSANSSSNSVATLAVQQQPASTAQKSSNNGGKNGQQPAAQLPEVISRQPKKQAKKEPDADLIDIDCFMDDDMFEQKKTEFQQYEQKVKNIDVNTEQYDPHQQSATNEAYHRNHPHEKYDYKENILLINEQELMMVSNAQEFCEKIGYHTGEQGRNRLVKVCSVFGNTGRKRDLFFTISFIS